MDELAEQTPSEAIASGFDAGWASIRADIRALRVEARADLKNAEDRMTAQVSRLEGDFHDFAKTHTETHRDEALARRRDHDRYDSFLKRLEIDDAVKAGMLATIRLTFEWAARYGRPLISFIVALAVLFGFVTGNLHFSVGVGA